VSELPIDYYKKLQNYTGKGNNLPHWEDSRWPAIHHSQYDQVVEKVTQCGLLVLSGRRRIGKSYMVCQIARSIYSGKVPVFYIAIPREVNGNVVPYFFAHFCEEVEAFDNTIQRPSPGLKAASLCIELIGWLLRSGVVVIIDEFQNLNSLSYRIRELIDWQRQKFTGRLICLGSHSTALKRMITGGDEPLYGRGFEHLVITPTSPSTVCKLLRQVDLGDTKLGKRQLVFLYSFFDGILQWYEKAFRDGELKRIAEDMDQLIACILIQQSTLTAIEM
jgi:predicted AAA+ superfamily ATPase